MQSVLSLDDLKCALKKRTEEKKEAFGWFPCFCPRSENKKKFPLFARLASLLFSFFDFCVPSVFMAKINKNSLWKSLTLFAQDHFKLEEWVWGEEKKRRRTCVLTSTAAKETLSISEVPMMRFVYLLFFVLFSLFIKNVKFNEFFNAKCFKTKIIRRKKWRKRERQ